MSTARRISIRRGPSLAAAVTITMLLLASGAQAGDSRFTGSLSQVRFLHSAFLFPDGKVVLFGGYNGPRETVRETEIYDPARGRWTTGSQLQTGRVFHTAMR